MFTIAIVLLFTYQTNAQFSLNVSLNSRPTYSNPHYHYDTDVDYYYLPEIEAYFDNRDGIFIYYGSRGWIRSFNLPSHCNNFNIHNGVKIALDYHGNAPFEDHHYHKKRYYKSFKKYYCNNNDNGNYYGKVKHHKNKHNKNKHCD